MDIALIGYGEVGRILGEDLCQGGHSVRAFDTALPTERGAAMREHAAQHSVELTRSHVEAVQGCELVFSAVTASQTVAAAESCVPGLSRGFFLDFNSASPGTKQRAAAYVGRTRAHFVEGAVMAAVLPYRLRVPLLLGGPHAAELLPLLEGIGFSPQVASDRLGVASATKLCRSVMIKGLEALVIESLTAARGYGVEDAVLASLHETFPEIDWEQQANYYFERVIAHGHRRGEEMRQAAETVSEAGIDAWAATATAERQSWVATLFEQLFADARRSAAPTRADWRDRADRILSRPSRSEGS